MIKGKLIFDRGKKYYISESPQLLLTSQYDKFLIIKVRNLKNLKNLDDYFYIGISEYDFDKQYKGQNNVEVISDNLKRVDILQVYYEYMDEYSRYFSYLFNKKNKSTK